MMEVDRNSSPNLDESTLDGDNNGENSNSMPGSTEQVTESGTSIDFETSELWLEFKCVFCNQDLKNITLPKLLPCLHTACESCLKSESNNSESAASSSVSGRIKPHVKKRTKTGNKQLSCASCSQEINIDDTVDHLFLTEYAQNSESLPEECSYSCSCEEGAEGTSFCMECQEWLCESCVTAHKRVRVTKDHIVRPKEEMEGESMANRNQKYLFCPVHSHEQLRLYCETCDKLTCRDCQLSDHKEHKYQFLEKACEDERGLIEELLSKIKERQESLEAASENLNRRNEEIKEREKVVTQDIKTFAVKYITDINKRAKVLLQELNKVCSNKKNELSAKNLELSNISDRLKHCQKFAEAAMSLGSETALVYSKKPIMNQLRRILRQRCEVPNSNQMFDMSFEYETSFLTNYITSIGKILVDKQPLPGSANQNMMLPMPNTICPSSMTNNTPHVRQPQMQMNAPRQVQAPLAPPIQQMHQQVSYNQPQVTSSTDMNRNHATPMRQVPNAARMVYRNNVRPNMGQSPQQNNFNIQNPAAFQQPRQAQPQTRLQLHQQQQQQQLQQQQHQQQQRIQHQIQQQQQQQQQQQLQQSQQQQQTFNSNNVLPMPLRQNKSLSVTAVPSSGPSPNKQRAIAPRSNMSVSNQGSSAVRSNQSSQNNAPQVIVLDDPPNQKTMSNTSRLSHFPSNLAATLAANPSLQIQPTSYNSSSKF